MRSVRVPLFDLKQVESITKLVKLKLSFSSGKWLDESEVGLKVFIFKSPAKSKLLYLFKALLRVTEISSKYSVFEKFGGRLANKIHHFFLAIVISMQIVSAFCVSNFGILFARKPSRKQTNFPRPFSFYLS